MAAGDGRGGIEVGWHRQTLAQRIHEPHIRMTDLCQRTYKLHHLHSHRPIPTTLPLALPRLGVDVVDECEECLFGCVA